MRSQRARRADRFPVELRPAPSVWDRGTPGQSPRIPLLFFVDRAYLDVLCLTTGTRSLGKCVLVSSHSSSTLTRASGREPGGTCAPPASRRRPSGIGLRLLNLFRSARCSVGASRMPRTCQVESVLRCPASRCLFVVETEADKRRRARPAPLFRGRTCSQKLAFAY